MYGDQRKINPNFPFSPRHEFCTEHDADDQVRYVNECEECYPPNTPGLSDAAKALFPTQAEIVKALNALVVSEMCVDC